MKVLVAEDDAVSRRVLQKRLTDWGYDAVVVEDGDQAWSILQGDEPPTLALLDWMMPKLDGPEICMRLRKVETTLYTYVILVTGKSTKEDIIAGLEAGADDYVTKPFDAQELEIRLRIGRRILSLQSELYARATRDPLTGAWNRRAAIDMLSREIVRGARMGAPVAVVLADTDHFKSVNDEHGHLAGDAVLREVVDRLSSAIRPYDVLGRYGGEEFLVILPNCDEAIAGRVAERMRRCIAATPVTATGRSLAVQASFGAAAHRADETVEALIARADEALYRAKREGRNRVVVASAEDAIVRRSEHDTVVGPEVIRQLGHGSGQP